MQKSEAIAAFLSLHTHPDLAKLYDAGHEVQVNAAKDDGKLTRMGEFKGKEWNAYTNEAGETWKSFRIPLNAKSDPTANDGPMNMSLSVHAEAIGLTGWHYATKQSRWVAFDFDAIVGHSDTHSKKLTDIQLEELLQVVQNIPFITVRKSTSGKGLHLYVFLEPVETANHTEHAALARAILSMVSGLSGYDFASKVDVCGGNMWIWHRKMYQNWKAGGTQGPKNDGLKLIKQGIPLDRIPPNWRDHIGVVTHKKSKATPEFVYNIDDTDPNRLFDELTGQRSRTPLDTEHKRLLDYLASNNCAWDWRHDDHMLLTHTFHLMEAHRDLKLRGPFCTIATGSERGSDFNAFAFPMRNGAWGVRRYSLGTKEADTWEQDGKGWTRCTLNRDPELKTVTKLNGGVETDKGSYYFQHAEQILKVLTTLGISLDLPAFIMNRPSYLRPMNKEGKIVVQIVAEPTDNPTALLNWHLDKKYWKRVISVKLPPPMDAEINDNYDDFLRHCIAGESDAGWLIKRDGWVEEPLIHVKHVLASMNHEAKEIQQIIGSTVMRGWKLVNKPFQPEYPGNREWNRNAAQLAVAPNPETDNLSYPTWLRVLSHCGKGLDEAISGNAWCLENGINCGADFLMLWIASIIKRPEVPTTYLAFWGPQDSGKSIFHEMISEILLTCGVMRADIAITSGGNFNAELRNAVICVIEEINLKKDKNAYSKIKDLVTSPQIMIHQKGMTPYLIRNCTHYCQFMNEQENCPVFDGDTRITMIYVEPLEEIIPKPVLLQMLRKEASDFIAAIMLMELPESYSRLGVPTIDTQSKQRAAEKNENLLEQFMREYVYEIPGQSISCEEFRDTFHSWLDSTDRTYWTKQRIGRELPERIPRGRLGSDESQMVHYGNMTFVKDAPARPRYYLRNRFLSQIPPKEISVINLVPKSEQ